MLDTRRFLSSFGSILETYLRDSMQYAQAFDQVTRHDLSWE